jgi:intein/homing endonuclease
MVLLPSIVGRILVKFCGSQVGDLKHIPNVILKANKKSKSLFLRALFDDEGSVHKTIQEITFQMASKDIVEKVKRILKEFDIKAGKICERKDEGNVKIQYRINISGRANLEQFFKKIGFDHPKKRERLKIRIKSYKMFRRKKGEDEKLIIEMLKKGNKMNKYEVARKLKGKPDSVRKKLRKLEREGMINSIRDGKLKVYYL